MCFLLSSPRLSLQLLFHKYSFWCKPPKKLFFSCIYYCLLKHHDDEKIRVVYLRPQKHHILHIHLPSVFSSVSVDWKIIATQKPLLYIIHWTIINYVVQYRVTTVQGFWITWCSTIQTCLHLYSSSEDQWSSSWPYGSIFQQYDSFSPLPDSVNRLLSFPATFFLKHFFFNRYNFCH